MRKFFGLRFFRRFKTTKHIRVVIRHPATNMILLVKNIEGDGLWHLPGGRSRLQRKAATPVRSAVHMVETGLGEKLFLPHELMRYKKGKIGLSRIIVVMGFAAIDLTKLTAGNLDYRWYVEDDLLRKENVDGLTKHAVRRAHSDYSDSRSYENQVVDQVA